MAQSGALLGDPRNAPNCATLWRTCAKKLPQPLRPFVRNQVPNQANRAPFCPPSRAAFRGVPLPACPALFRNIAPRAARHCPARWGTRSTSRFGRPRRRPAGMECARRNREQRLRNTTVRERAKSHVARRSTRTNVSRSLTLPVLKSTTKTSAEPLGRRVRQKAECRRGILPRSFNAAGSRIYLCRSTVRFRVVHRRRLRLGRAPQGTKFLLGPQRGLHRQRDDVEHAAFEFHKVEQVEPAHRLLVR